MALPGATWANWSRYGNIYSLGLQSRYRHTVWGAGTGIQSGASTLNEGKLCEAYSPKTSNHVFGLRLQHQIKEQSCEAHRSTASNHVFNAQFSAYTIWGFNTKWRKSHVRNIVLQHLMEALPLFHLCYKLIEN